VKITTDTLAIMNDDDLYSLFRKIKNRITEVSVNSSKASTSSKKGLLYYLQADLCYVQREVLIRKDRNDAHELWIQRQL